MTLWRIRSNGVPERSRWLIWFGFAAAALLLLDVFSLAVWSVLVTGVALLLVFSLSVSRADSRPTADKRDLAAVGALYVLVVALFRLAFTVFTVDNVLGLFVAFAGGLLMGVLGPIGYEVWLRGRDLRSLGIGLHRLHETVVVGLVLGAVQFGVTLRGYQLPEPVDWVPLLMMSLVVGFFEAVFFRGFIQNRLEASFGTAPAVAGAALLYAVYHVGYGMGANEMWFLFGLGLVYAIVFRLSGNVLVLWPLLTPLGAFFNNLRAGDIELPWASIAGFAEVGVVMAIAIWLAHRHITRRDESVVQTPKQEFKPRQVSR